MRAAITGLGAAVPGVVLDNDALIARFGLRVDADWIVANTGVRSRHWLEPGRTTSDLAAEAAARALADAGLRPRDVDRLYVATASPDLPTPATATRVLAKLGARCAAVDLAATCAGFVYGLDAALGAIARGARRVLVVCAEARSRFLDPTDHRGLVLFADAAAAVVVEPSGEDGIVAVHVGGEGMEMLGASIAAGGAARPATAATVAEGAHHLKVDGRREIFAEFLRLVDESVAAVLAEAGATLADVDLLVPHQGNARLTEAIGRRLGVPPERVADTIARHGNVSGASIPLALADLRAAGRLRRGDRVLLTAVGAGAAFGSALIRWTR